MSFVLLGLGSSEGVPATGASDTRREQILEQVRIACAGISGVGTVTLTPTSPRNEPELTFPAIMIKAGASVDDGSGSLGYTGYSLTITVAGMTTGSAEDLMSSMHAALAADRTWGGLADWTEIQPGEPAAEWDIHEGIDLAVFVLTCVYELSDTTI